MSSGRGRHKQIACPGKCAKARRREVERERQRASFEAAPGKIKVCICCRRPFSTSGGQGNKVKICGDVCRAKLHREYARRSRARRSPKGRDCIYCNDWFPTTGRSRAMTCSKPECVRHLRRAQHAKWAANNPERLKEIGRRAALNWKYKNSENLQRTRDYARERMRRLIDTQDEKYVLNNRRQRMKRTKAKTFIAVQTLIGDGMINYKTKTTEWLKARLANIDAAAAKSLLEAAQILSELHKRKENVPQMRSGYLKFFREISDGKLSAEAVLGISLQSALPALMRLPIADQISLVRGGAISVAEHDSAGNIRSVDKDPNAMTLGQWELAIGEKGFRPYNEQKRILSRRGPDVRRSSSVKDLRFDASTKEVVCGRMRISVRDLMSLLRKHGYEIDAPTKATARFASDAHPN